MDEIKPIKTKREAIYNYIKNYIKENGYGPTTREIAEACHITVGGAYYHILGLEQEKLIYRTEKKARSLQINEKERIVSQSNLDELVRLAAEARLSDVGLVNLCNFLAGKKSFAEWKTFLSH